MDADGVQWLDGSGAANAPYAGVSESQIVGGTFDVIDLAHGTVRDLALSRVASASISLRGAHVRRLLITGGRIGTLDFADATVDELILENVRVDYLSFNRATATDISIDACVIGSLDAPAATLTRVRVGASRIDELDMRDTKNSDVDLRGADVSAHLDTRGLSGVTMTELQVQLIARDFARAAGVDVRG